MAIRREVVGWQAFSGMAALILLASVAVLGVRSATAVTLNPSQAEVLEDCEREWRNTYLAWDHGADCDKGWGISCDAAGFITRFNMWYEFLNGTIPASLGRLVQLTSMDMAENKLTGSIPSSFGSLTKLRVLDLESNRLTGPIPQSLSNLVVLTQLHLAGNNLTGSVPPFLSAMRSLVDVELHNNAFSGSLPASLGLLTNLTQLQYDPKVSCPPTDGYCREKKAAGYTGSLFCRSMCPAFCKTCRATALAPQPGWVLRECEREWRHTFAGWTAAGSDCSSAMGLTCTATGAVVALNVSSQGLHGTLPQALGNLTALTFLDVHNNSLSGNIPSALATLLRLRHLDLSMMALNGTVPAWLGNMTSLTYLDMHGNSGIKGQLPDSFGNLANLQHLAYDAVIGCPAANSYCPSKLLPGFNGSLFCRRCSHFCASCSPVPLPLPPSTPPPQPLQSTSADGAGGLSTAAIAGITVAAVAVLTVACAVAVVIMNSRGSRAREQGLRIRRVREFTMRQLSDATQCFSDTCLLGRGGFGEVYKGILPSGEAVAVKRGVVHGKAKVAKGDTGFRNEIEVLSSVRHNNLVSLVGYCWHADDQLLLVYEYVPNGSLQDLIDNGDKRLTWERRMRIALGAAEGLDYLHRLKPQAIIHRDVKPANILIDATFNAKVADFGLSRIQPDPEMAMGMSTCVTASVDTIMSESSMPSPLPKTTVKGTLGYLDPAYFRSGVPTEKSDVYSFGVVLLQLATGLPYRNNNMHIAKLVALKLKAGELSSLAPSFLPTTEGATQSFHDVSTIASPTQAEPTPPLSKPVLSSVAFEGMVLLGLECCARKPDARPTMRNVAVALLRLVEGGSHGVQPNVMSVSEDAAAIAGSVEGTSMAAADLDVGDSDSGFEELMHSDLSAAPGTSSEVLVTATSKSLMAP